MTRLHIQNLQDSVFNKCKRITGTIQDMSKAKKTVKVDYEDSENKKKLLIGKHIHTYING